VPRGGHFDQAPLADSELQSVSSHDVDQRSDASGSSSDYQIPQKSRSPLAMNWNNNSSQSSIRTSLRGGGNLGQNRLATGFRSQSERAGDGKVPVQDIVEISDDESEEVEDDSEGGGILLNVGDAPSGVNSSIEAASPGSLSDDEGRQIAASASHRKDSTSNAKAEKPPSGSRPQQSTALSTSSSNKSGATSPMFQVDTRRGSRILADLNPDDLEKQIKYTLFHLPRDQIDLSRPVICLACLNEGHTDQYCLGLLCSSCGGQTKHSSRLCPRQRRCSRCGQRGHDVGACQSKLRNENLDPCEFCAGTDHVEASCTQRFFPARSELPGRELRLWISCAQCGSKEHLAGDCPAFGSASAHAWSLRAYSHDKIINLSLQTGAQAREKEALNKGVRPEGLQIRGRGAGRGAPNPNKYQQGGKTPQFEEDDDFTTRIASNRSRRPSPRNHIRFDDDGRGRMHRGNDDGYYRQRSNRFRPSDDYDSYQPPPPSEYRDRNGYGGRRGYQEDRDYHDRRPRSRSPPRHVGPFEGDTWRPPPPRSPPPHVSLPARPAPPRPQQQSQNPSQRPSKKGKRGAGKAKGGGGGAAVKSMPSAAKNAWNRGRL
jgi:protein AIR1/2